MCSSSQYIWRVLTLVRCKTCANIVCPIGQERDPGLPCDGTSKGFTCRAVVNPTATTKATTKTAATQPSCGALQFFNVQSLACEFCRNRACPGGSTRQGQCAGLLNTFTCEPLPTKCPDGQFVDVSGTAPLCHTLTWSCALCSVWC